ncbi:MAG: hypothetical protein Q8Q54_05155 [Methylococcales bacterium]|nr:hypothetical protein [Methylococcales bacterium]MDP3838293.1 hypothetical protein [Methylococcales bacterium]
MSLIEFAQLLYDSEMGTALRESIYAFPIVEGLHLIGLAFSFGLLMFIDLRLLGVFLESEPAQELLHSLRPWLLVGFVVTVITGILLFIATATKVILLPVFYIKLGFIVLAGINAVVFELKWGRNVDDWGAQSVLPNSIKYAGLASLVLWSVVIIAGRLIPYLNYE